MALIDDEEEPPDSTVNIVFIRDKQIIPLNKKYRGTSRATDVISFNLDDRQGPNSILGEIYISTDTAARNAAEYGVSFTGEVLRLCCHGFLHLLGYDHKKPRDRARMEAKERRYLGGIGQ
jgi:probable rRNA maturation factor